MAKAIFFDLFGTLLVFKEELEKKEAQLLQISQEEWEQCRKAEFVYNARMKGVLNSEYDVIREMLSHLESYTAGQEYELLECRRQWMHDAMVKVNGIVSNTLSELKERGYRLGVISNADVIDRKYFAVSPLKEQLEQVVFSSEVHMQIPERAIYEYALEQMRVHAGESIYVGSGQEKELWGAHLAGMKTVLSQQFLPKEQPGQLQQENMMDADYCISDLSKLLEII